MISNPTISQIRHFVNKEKVYVLMLSFILLVNAWMIFTQKIPGLQELPIAKNILEQRTFAQEIKKELAQDDIRKVSMEKAIKKIPLAINMVGMVIFFLFALGLFLDIRILMAKIRKRRILPVLERHAQPKWGIWDIVKLAIIFVFFGYIIHLIELTFLPFLLQNKSALISFSMLNTGIMDLLLLGLIFYFLKVKYKQSVAAIGFKFKSAGKSVLLAVLSYIAFVPFLVLLLLLMVILASLFSYHPPQQSLFKLFLEERKIWLLVYSTMMVILLGPIAEEVLFRGFSYNAIKRRWGSNRAMVLTAAIFAGLHTNIFGFLPIMALGILLAYVYEKTGNLICSITIHILHNSLMVTLLFLARYFMHIAGSS